MRQNEGQRLRLVFCLGPAAATLAQPAFAQDDQAPPEPDSGRLVIDILDTPAAVQEDILAEEQCEEEADAGQIANQIVVCRALGETTDGVYDHQDFLRRYAESTQGPKTPDFILSCHDQGWPPGCVRLGSVPPPALIIDVEALPEAPPGSDADRIARGLPALGEGGDEGREPIGQVELGLPPLPER